MSITGLREIDIIATVGPQSLTHKILCKMVDGGVSMVRINGSHESIKNVENLFYQVREWVGERVKILVDLPGNKVRVNHLNQPIKLSIGSEMKLFRHQVNYESFFDVVRKGDELIANDGLLRMEVLQVSSDELVLKSKSNGELSNNRGLHTHLAHPLPFLFEKDYQILDMAKALPFDYVGLSFVRTQADVRLVEGILKESPVKMIVKIETKEAVSNLEDILVGVERILIDRGDLSADIGYVNIPYIQDSIMKSARRRGVKVALATQFLHSMLTRDVPAIAEVEAIFHAIKSGASALQVSEETAVGQYPVEVIRVIADMTEQALRTQGCLTMDESYKEGHL